MSKLKFLAAIVFLCLGWQSSQAAELGQLGRIRFPTSANQAAQEHFLTGVAYLHSFGWKQARVEFLRARELDPDFALSYWGESLTYNHPFQPERDASSPARVLSGLGESGAARLARARNPLEAGLLAAVEAYAFTEGDGTVRRQAFKDSMAELLRQFPEHEEVRAFYALALLSVASSASGAERMELRKQAGAIAQALFADNDRHPGAVHYLIHSHDDPDTAVLALRAADRYAEIAPVVSHARHMPTHVYIHLGRWFEVADLNETAFYTARALWMPGDEPDDQNHALEFGQYGDLQLANYEDARRWIERARDTLAQNPGNENTRQTLGRLHARYIIESKQWQYGAADNSSTSDELFAVGLSATNMRDLALAREALELLAARAGNSPGDAALRVMQLELEASILFASGQQEQALSVMEQAVDLALASPNTDPLPYPVKPPLEMKGEMLLRAGMLEQAITTFRQSLTVTPFRPWSILGLARSYASAGQMEQATSYYELLLQNWDDASLLGVSEARTHISLQVAPPAPAIEEH